MRTLPPDPRCARRARRARRARPARAALLPALLLLGACGSSPAPSADDHVLRATLIDYTANLQFAILSEATAERVEVYSQLRRDPSRKTKVESVDFLDAVGEQMAVLEFDELASEGPAPALGSGPWQKAIELETGRGVRHVVSRADQPAERRSAVFKMTAVFLSIFNSVEAYQNVENQAGADIFSGAQVGDGKP